MIRRLAACPTQVIERSKPVTFFFNGKPMSAYKGDTVASALHAAGIRHLADSFKYHRPRGLMELGVQAADPLMTVNGQPNVRIARVPVGPGMQVVSQSSPGPNLYQVADKLAGLLPVGFYYKNPLFYSWRKVWDAIREALRRAPGNLGGVQRVTITPHFEAIHLTPELLVIGGGLAGLAAARVAAEAGVRVVLVEAEPWLGGFQACQGGAAQAELLSLQQKLRSFDHLTCLMSATACIAGPDGLFIAVQPALSGAVGDGHENEKTFLIRPRAVVFATGAMDRPLMFSNNDRPGILLPQTAQRLLHLYGLTPAARVMLAGGDDNLYRIARDLVAQGISVAGLADCRSDTAVDPELAHVLTRQQIPVWFEQTVIDVRGAKTINGAVIAKLGQARGRHVPCDGLIAASGRTPLLKLVAQTEARITFNGALGFHQATGLAPQMATAGRLNGWQDAASIEADGQRAAADVLITLGLNLATVRQAAADRLAGAPAPKPNPSQMRAVSRRQRRFICPGSDVTEKDVDQALAEGFSNLEMLKRYTTATMGTEQGTLSQANFLDYLAFRQPDQLGAQHINTPRPPLVGVSLGALAAGHHDHPRITPLHQVQLEQGAQLVRSGPWLRVDHFGHPEAESLALHQAAVLLDVSTLGKFRIFGPQAANWLALINTRSVQGLPTNRIRYMAACNEEGVVIDDGVVIQVAENDYYFTTSTARAAAVVSWYQRFKTSSGQAWLVNLTDARAAVNLVGPSARDILAAVTSADVSSTALPFMGWIRAEVAGIPCTILRLGFLGELSYEIHCPSSQAVFLWERLREAGAPYHLTLAGLETQFVCRLEKGHILPGLDADGNTTMFESGFDWLWDRTNTTCVGAPMLKLLENHPFQKQIIAFRLEGRSGLRDGHLVVRGRQRMGYITSVRYSPQLDQTIGLALLEPPAEYPAGAPVFLRLDGREICAQVIVPPFYDSDGERMKS